MPKSTKIKHFQLSSNKLKHQILFGKFLYSFLLYRINVSRYYCFCCHMNSIYQSIYLYEYIQICKVVNKPFFYCVFCHFSVGLLLLRFQTLFLCLFLFCCCLDFFIISLLQFFFDTFSNKIPMYILLQACLFVRMS